MDQNVRFSLSPTASDRSDTREFAQKGRVRIPSFLRDDQARRLASHLLSRSDWREVLNSGERIYELDRVTRAGFGVDRKLALDEAVREAATNGFQFRYETIRADDDPAKREASPLDEFATWLSGPKTREWLRRVTGLEAIEFADAQATLYGSGHFLTTHDDDVAGKGRLAAYVLSLTDGWRPEWGGNLLFVGPDGELTGYTPVFNTLTLFRVPMAHFVSEVASYAAGARLSVTGWLRRAPSKQRGGG